jgi:hypothetical protein
MIRRPWGTVKHIVSVCQAVGMTCGEIHFGTGIPIQSIKYAARHLGVRLRDPSKPLIKYYVRTDSSKV